MFLVSVLFLQFVCFYFPSQFYFGYHNLPRDKFLRSEVQKNDGCVPLGVMIRFNRYGSLVYCAVLIVNIFFLRNI